MGSSRWSGSDEGDRGGNSLVIKTSRRPDRGGGFRPINLLGLVVFDSFDLDGPPMTVPGPLIYLLICAVAFGGHSQHVLPAL